jgi:type I restriction-modification system DNA methylase subunit/restriction endonuclease S subunit
MSKQYSCEMCKKVFTQKIDFTRHQSKKAPCISLNEIKDIVKINETKTDTKNTLISVFKSCLDTMRDNEGLTGEKALRNLSYLLTLKLLEPRFNNEINIDDYDFKFDEYENNDNITEHKEKLLKIVRFSVLSKEKETDIPVMIKSLWDDILSKHPSTQKIFLKEKGFDIQRQSTFKKLIEKLNSLDLSKTDHDVLGNAYEEVIKDIMTGKVLGQFFTQPLIKKMMVKLINPQLHQDGKTETCCDPTMGTAGFLTEYLKHILHQANVKNIKPDWNFIKTSGLYGKELEPDTYQLAVSNMLISSGHMFEKLDRGDSIRQPITEQYDTVLANPPFGIKGLRYDDFESEKKIEYLPIKSDNAVSLFIQAIIYILKINGRCAVVLPDGQDLFSKTNKTLIAVREFLMKTCDLKEIIYLPSGIFNYTSIKTCVFYFIKKKNGKEVLEIKTKETKAKKTSPREYKFTKTHQTSNVKFYDYNPYEDIKNLLVEVPIDKIANNSYSLNYAEYMKDETEDEEQYEEGIVVKTLGEICEFLPKSKRQASYGEDNGKYPFYTSSQICSKYCDEYDYEDYCIIIGTGGNANVKYSNNFSCSADNFVIKNKDNNMIKYIYYYLMLNIEVLQKGFIGVGLQHISKDYIKTIKIPIPPIKYQKIAIEYLDSLYASNKSSNEKIDELKILTKKCFTIQKTFGENKMKILGNICEFIKTGKNKPSDNKTGTLYPYYGTGSITGYTDEYLYDGQYILTARNGTIGNCFLTEGRFFPSDHMFVINIKDKNLMKYVYYYIMMNTEMLDKLKTGIGIPNITKSILENIKIPIPSLERQKQIVEFCEQKDTLIKQLEKEIENNKQIAQEFITNIVKAKIQPLPDDDFDNSLSTDDDKKSEKEKVQINKKTSDDVSFDKSEKKKKYIIKTESTSDDSSSDKSKKKKKDIIKTEISSDDISSDKTEKTTSIEPKVKKTYIRDRKLGAESLTKKSKE